MSNLNVSLPPRVHVCSPEYSCIVTFLYVRYDTSFSPRVIERNRQGWGR